MGFEKLNSIPFIYLINSTVHFYLSTILYQQMHLRAIKMFIYYYECSYVFRRRVVPSSGSSVFLAKFHNYYKYVRKTTS
jgi:hypothetical protein